MNASGHPYKTPDAERTRGQQTDAERIAQMEKDIERMRKENADLKGSAATKRAATRRNTMRAVGLGGYAAACSTALGYFTQSVTPPVVFGLGIGALFLGVSLLAALQISWETS